jgi:hypothetical protein
MAINADRSLIATIPLENPPMIRTSLFVASLCLALLAPIGASAQWPGSYQGYSGPGPAPSPYGDRNPQQERCAGLQQALADMSAHIEAAPPSWERQQAEIRRQQVRETMRNECGI